MIPDKSRIGRNKKVQIGWLWLGLMLVVCAHYAGQPLSPNRRSIPKEEVQKMLAPVKWLGHATIKLSGSKIIYFDPYRLTQNDQADLVLITHDHYDHLSPKDLDKVRTAKTIIILPKGSKNPPQGDVRFVQPGDKVTIEGVAIQVVPAYNSGKQFHPRSAGYVGYIVTLDGVKYYHAGDTDLIPEMKELCPDVAFLPVGGTYTMTAAEAARAAEIIKPKIAVPIHWGAIVGSQKDAVQFKELTKSCEVQILTP